MAKTLLIVDDSTTVTTAVDWMFRNTDWTVLTAASAAEARDQIRTHAPDIALIDYHLPDGSGVDLCQALRADPDCSQLRIILVGGRWHPHEDADAVAAGAHASILKPFRSEALLETIEEALAATDGPPAPAAPEPLAPAPEADVAPVTAPTYGEEEEEELVFVIDDEEEVIDDGEEDGVSADVQDLSDDDEDLVFVDDTPEPEAAVQADAMGDEETADLDDEIAAIDAETPAPPTSPPLPSTPPPRRPSTGSLRPPGALPRPGGLRGPGPLMPPPASRPARPAMPRNEAITSDQPSVDAEPAPAPPAAAPAPVPPPEPPVPAASAMAAAPAAPGQLPQGPTTDAAAAGPPAATPLDPEALRAIVREELPAIVRELLAQLLRE